MRLAVAAEGGGVSMIGDGGQAPPAAGAADEPAGAAVAGTRVAGALAELAGRIGLVGELTRAEQVALLTELLAAKDVLASLVSQVGAAVESSRAWRIHGPAGARDYADWLGRLSRGGVVAGRAAKTKQTVLTAMPTWQGATTEGTPLVTEAHVAALGRVLENAEPDTVQRLLEHEGELLARARETDATTFARQVRAQAAAWEADAADASFEQSRQKRFLRLTAAKGSVRVEGSLDPVAGETVRLALEAVTPAPGVNDERSSDQRRADAFTDLATRALGYGQKKGSQLRPTITVVMREETLVAARQRQELAAEGSSGDGAQGTQSTQDTQGGRAATARPRGERATARSGEAFRRSGLDTEPPLAELENRATLAPAVVEMLLCDAVVRRLVVDPAGQPLDVGLAERTFTGPLRAAILTRDRHCQWPGCTLRASWSEVHHVTYWRDRGGTSLTNGVTLCSFHHHVVHRDAVRITPKTGGFAFAARDGTPIGTTTRLADHILVPAPGAGPEPVPGAREDSAMAHGERLSSESARVADAPNGEPRDNRERAD